MGCFPSTGAADGAAERADPRRRILEAAIRCFLRNGFHSASMQMICAEARMSPGSVYRHFRSKDEIIGAIAEIELEQGACLFEPLHQAADPVRGIVQLADDYLRSVAASPEGDLCADVMAEARRSPAVKALFARNIAKVRGEMETAIRRGQESGHVDPDLDPRLAAALLNALGDGLCAHMALDPELAPDRVGPLLGLFAERFLRPPSPGRSDP